MKLTSRQQKILLAVVEEYVKAAVPVSSKDLVEKYDFSFSPATLRSEMANLEELGYLYQPHISAGRIPTDKGYRFFVDIVSRDEKYELEDMRRLQAEILRLQVREKRMARTLAKMLSVFSSNLAITGLIEEKEFFEAGMKSLITQPDFQSLDEVSRIVEVLDYLDENIEGLVKELKPREVETFIGEESPFTESSGCAIVISQCILPEGEKGIVAILGPKRMEYQKNISLIKHVANILDQRHAKKKKS